MFSQSKKQKSESGVGEVKGMMDQETRWLTKYNEVVRFIETNRRNPSKHRIEEHDMLN